VKERLKALLKKKQDRKAQLGERAQETEDIQELRDINKELDALNEEIRQIEAMLEELEQPSEPNNQQQRQQAQQQRQQGPVGQTQILGTYGVGQGQAQAQATQQRSQEPLDPFGTIEYRQAFMQFAKTGKVTEALRPDLQPELRADAMTTAADVSAVIPSTILNEIVQKVEVYGQVFSRVRKTSIRGGVTVPILSLKPTATWIGEAATSDKQKVQANTNVSFSYYGLECKISTSLLADTVTLAGFENTLVDLITEAMVKALDAAIISGDGNNKALGITQDNRVPADQIVTLAAADFVEWDEWKKQVFAKMPLSYKAGAVFLMASGTFEGYIDGMVDANGQPIGRVNYGITDGAQERFGGKEVVLVEDDIIANYDDAAAGDVVAIYCNLRNYAINSNMQMTMFRYLDHDTNEWVDKAILIADGKLIDPNGVVIVKKGA